MLRLRCFHRLRPCWTAFLSILRDTELFGAERLAVWVSESERGDDCMIPLLRGPLVHVIGHAPARIIHEGL